jgi:HSP20 family protein
MTTPVTTKPMETDVEQKKQEMIFVPNVDAFEKENVITMIIDVPGADENSVDIEFEKGKLKVSAKVQRRVNKENYKILHSEYYVSNFERTFILPERVDAENITATVKDGILTLSIPKLKEMEAKKITVKSA